MTTTDDSGLAQVAAGVITDWEGPTVVPPTGVLQHFRDDRYLRLLLLLLVSAAFFEGYDSSILALLLPNIQSSFSVSEATLGITRIPIELGLFAAFFVARLSDRLGRRPTLLWSVVGYTIFTALTAVSWDIWSFALFQFASRVFLGAEYAIGVTMIVEEYPSDRRARALGTLLTFSALGTIAVGILLGAGLAGHLARLAGVLPGRPAAPARAQRLPPPAQGDPALRGGEGRPASRTSRSRRCWCRGARSTAGTSCSSGLAHMFRSIPLYGSTAWWAFYAERERGLHLEPGGHLHHLRLRPRVPRLLHLRSGHGAHRAAADGDDLRRRRHHASRSSCSRRRRRACPSSPCCSPCSSAWAWRR